ncbi:Error-prone DNA polymerase [Corynebacterium faecale]|uniref:error-prone DNA polymerase n=1 Tax=Corynebacterium faecale TaxID=1758466 RepID=UPI0025B2E1FD|nr:error-prone DNA polymerase [Corynebacterium faecale]WJY91390.1 Error-prone DNA polymerase [Corynebacterium faecale]
MEWETGAGSLNGRPLSWSAVEKILSGKVVDTPRPVQHQPETEGKPVRAGEPARAGDVAGAPARAPAGASVGAGLSAPTPFAELHAASSYSFLRGASDPEAMVARAHELGVSALALLDRDGFYGAVRFSEAAATAGLSTVFGAELSLGEGVLTVLCRGLEGYRRLSHLIASAKMVTGAKGEVHYPPLPLIAQQAGGHWVVVADISWRKQIDQLIDYFGEGNVVLEFTSRMLPEDADDHDILRSIQLRTGLRGIISTTPTAATRDQARLAGAKHALALRNSLSEAASELHPMGGTWLRSGEALLRAHPSCADLLSTTVDVARECAFPLNLVAPDLPRWDTPDGHTEMTWLTESVQSRFDRRYRSRSPQIREQAQKQIEHELDVIQKLGFPGYFLIVDDLVQFCHTADILCQGRGSAANSVVCFVLGITNAEPISAGLLFERFLSPDRDGPPDIDIDIESGRREEVIQYVYTKYGRDNAAQVANVITYRTKGAMRDAARALGYPQGAADAWAKGTSEPPDDVVELAGQLTGHPRHLGIHSGGMVICDRPIADVVPTEWARMQGRSVVQWDKDDCAAAGLVKFDLLGLGMLEALHHMMDLVKEHRGTTINLWELDLTEPEVYDMLCRADAVGVFQVESRAQMSTLPRLKPRTFFDLVVEVALIRPGPIQGGSVHPYLRRRNGEEAITYDHPVLEKSLGKTLGIPLFQEQLMQVAVDAAGFTGGEADALRRAMGSKRSPARMAALKARFHQGLKNTQGITGDTADKLWNKIVAFAAYGFPESHSQSFASLVYFSAWFKYHYPAEFCVGLLRAQPMGFYSPQSLIADARRHGVEILPITVNDSGVEADAPDGKIRLGLNLIKGLGDDAATRIEQHAPYTSIQDLSRRADLSVAHVETLARAGALDCLGINRREALWQAGIAATERPGMLPGLSAIDAPALPGMNAFDLMVTSIAATGVTHDQQPMAMLRTHLDSRGITPADQLLHGVSDGTRVRIAGVVTHRQRPQTASGVTFLGLEDETGLMNVMISPGLWNRQRVLARTARTLIIRGIVQNANGAVNVVADRLEPLPVGEWLSRGARDFK